MDRRVVLFDYQRDLVQQILSLFEVGGGTAALVSLPTGAGKTRTAMWAVLELISLGRCRRVLWLAPSRELLDQAGDAASLLWGSFPACDRLELTFGHRGRITTWDSRVPGIHFCTPQMLYSQGLALAKRLNAQCVVFDEAHFAIAPTYSRSIAKLVREGAVLIGLSATPGRRVEAETDALVELFGRRMLVSGLLGRRPLETLVARGVLAEVSFERIPVAASARSSVIEAGRRRTARLLDLAGDPDRFNAVVDAIERSAGDGPALVFAQSIDHAHALCAAMLALNVPSEVVSSEMESGERVAAIDRFRRGSTRVLINKQILATGFDFPAVRTAVLTVPIGSPILFEQIVGRVSRGPEVGGNRASRVLSIDDNLGLNGMPASYGRFRDFEWDVTADS